MRKLIKKEGKQFAKRVLSLVMALSMMFSSMSTAVFASGENDSAVQAGICEHHTHDESCGYVEAVEGADCTHEHDENCAYVAAVEEVLCTCTETDANGALVHAEGCGYVAPVKESCNHSHDENCGYVEAVEGNLCDYSCEVCAEADNTNDEGSEQTEETIESDPVTALFDTLMAFQTYEELGDYMDNMSEEEYQLMAQFSDEQNAALQARVDELSEYEAEVLPNENGTPTNDETTRALQQSFSHLDIRVPGASITITNQMVDLISNEVIGSESRTVDVNVQTVHSFVLYNIQEWESSWFWGEWVDVSERTYTGFTARTETTGVREHRKYIDDIKLTSTSRAVITVDLVDDEGTVYRNVVLNYDLDGLVLAAMNCDTYTTSGGTDYAGLDFNPASNVSYTSTYTNNIIPVVKVWDDNDNAYGERPESLTIRLLANGVDTGETLTLTADGGWKGQFENLDATDTNGAAITYSVQEVVPEGYTGTDPVEVNNFPYGNSTISAWEFTNKPSKISIQARKIWDDNNNAEGLRPESVTFCLMNGETEVKSITLDGTVDENGETAAWVATFDGMDPAIDYTLAEVEVKNYTSQVGGNQTDGFTVTNSRDIDTSASLTVKKNWRDDSTDKLMSQNMPNSVSFHVYADGNMMTYTQLEGKSTGATVENVNGHAVIKIPKPADNITESWIATLSGLQKYSGGKEISYTVSEHEDGELGDHFHVESITKTGNEVVVVNAFDMSTEAFTVRKDWLNEGNRDITRPSVYVQLYEKETVDSEWVAVETTNGTHMKGRVELNIGNSWSHTWNVPAEPEGKQYKVLEVDSSGNPVDEIPVNDLGKYVVSYNTADGIFNEQSRLVVITNTFEVAKVSVPVSKKWNGTEANNDVTVKLLANGEETNKTLILTEENGWKGQFENLDKSDDEGIDIKYTVEEVALAGYSPKVTGNAADGYTITNTELTSIEVYKVWEDSDNQYGKRPSSVTFNLLANNEKVSEAVLEGSTSVWKHTFTDLPKYDSEKEEIVYSVEEVVESNWDEYYKEPVVNGFTITNTLDRGTVTIELVINKTWYGAANAEIPWDEVKFNVWQNDHQR